MATAFGGIPTFAVCTGLGRRAAAVATFLSESQSSAPALRERSNMCIHWWIIEPPDGPTSEGVCQHCQETKEFPNAAASYSYRDPAMTRGVFTTHKAPAADKSVMADER